jgi:hypothetical protein
MCVVASVCTDARWLGHSQQQLHLDAANICAEAAHGVSCRCVSSFQAFVKSCRPHQRNVLLSHHTLGLVALPDIVCPYGVCVAYADLWQTFMAMVQHEQVLKQCRHQVSCCVVIAGRRVAPAMRWTLEAPTSGSPTTSCLTSTAKWCVSEFCCIQRGSHQKAVVMHHHPILPNTTT